MLKKLTQLKNIFCKTLLVLGIICLALFARIDYKTAKTVMAINKEDCSEDLLTTPNFYSSSSSNISSSSHWTTLVPNDETNSSSFKKGIVNVEKIESTIKADEEATNSNENGIITDNLWKNFGLFQSPGKISNVTLDEENQKGVNNYLMINAHNFSGHLGYESDDFTLEKSSFYKIAITLKTINAEKEVEIKENKNDELTTENRLSDAFASIYLNGISDETQTSKFEIIKTNNSWKTFYFYVNTSSFASEKEVSLQLYLGSKVDSCQGAVFFSDVKIEKYSESEYLKETTEATLSKNNVSKIDLNKEYIYNLINNQSFESNMNTWSTIGSANNGDIFTSIVDTSSTGHIKGNSKYPSIPNNNNSHESNINALAIYSKPDNETSTFYGVESNTFVINQYSLYRISVWAYCDSQSTNGAYITILDADNPTSKVSKQVSTTVSTSNALANNWTEYEFYIQGHSLRDANLKVQLSIGTEDKKDNTENYVMFDDIRVQEITYEEYNAGKGSDNTLALTPSIESENLIKNFTFDTIENNNENTNKAMTPSEWTLNTTNSYVYAGVINTNENHFATNSANYVSGASLLNPGKIDSSYPIDSNNVLMMGTTKDNLNINYKTTNTFTLSKSSYYKLSFDVFTQHFNDSQNGANFTLTDANESILLNVGNIRTNNAWASYTYYIATDLYDKTCTATLSLNQVAAYAYFDNIKLTKIEEAVYNELFETQNSDKFINLSKNLLANATAWDTSQNTDTAIVSFLDATDYEISVNDANIAHILADTDVKYYLTKKEKLNTDASSYYKVSVYVNTRNILKHNEDENKKYGASFLIKYDDNIEGIENISTKTNDFIKYTIYFHTSDATTIDIILGLGSDDNKVSGEVAFTNLEVVKFENEEAMTADKDSANADYITSIDLAPTTEDEEPSDDNDLTTFAPNWLMISSLITSAAMILAILAFFLRKINFKKRTKKVITNYDRRITLDKRIDMNERIEYREDLIEKLNKELLEIDNLKEAYTAEHKSKIDDLNNNTNSSSNIIKQQMQALYNEKLEISKAHNSIVAQDKLNTPKEEDLIYAEKVAKIEKQEKVLAKKLSQVEKAQNKEKANYEELIARANKRQDDIKAEIKTIKNEIVTINQELNTLNKGDAK